MKKRLKVLMVGQLPTEVGGNYTTGIARVVYELCKQEYSESDIFLYATNIKDRIANEISKYPNQYMGYRISPVKFLINMLKNPILTYRRWKHYKNKSYNNPLRFDFIRFNLERAIKLVKPDLIHMHGDGLDSLYFANKKYNIPILLTLHGVMWDGDYDDIITHNKYLNNMGFADYFTGLNEEVRRKMIQVSIPANKITLIPNGVDTKKYYFSKSARESIRAKFGISNDRVVFITVGLIIDRKGQLASLKILNSLGIDFEYWIIGEGPDMMAIRKFAIENDIEDRVKLLGYIKDTDLYKYHSGADIYLHASEMEGQALSETEAYASGLRVIVNQKIANTVVGNPYIDTETYYILKYDSPDYEELLEWISTPICQRVSRSNFSWSVIAGKYEKLYHKLINDNSL